MSSQLSTTNPALAQRQIEQRQGQVLSVSTVGSGAGSGSTLMLYGDYRAHHLQDYVGADAFSHLSNTTAAQYQQHDVLAAQRALCAHRQYQQLQHQLQQAREYEAQQQQQQQHQLLASCMQHYQQQQYQSQQPMSTVVNAKLQPQFRHYSQDSSLHCHSASAAQLPPCPAPAGSHGHHSFSNAAPGGLFMEQHRPAAGSIILDSTITSAINDTIGPFEHQDLAVPPAAVVAAYAAAPGCYPDCWSVGGATSDHSCCHEHTRSTALDPGSLHCDEQLTFLEGARQHKRQQLPGNTCMALAGNHTAGFSYTDQSTDLMLCDFQEDCGSTHLGSIGSGDMEDDLLAVQDQQWQGQQQGQHFLGDYASVWTPRGQAEEAVGAPQSVVLHMLNHVAASRKAQEMLTAYPAMAAAGGTQSVRSRLLIAEVSVYSARASNSLMALEQSNRLLAKTNLPGGIVYMPIQPDSFLFTVGSAWQFPAFVLCLGSSYFQRILAKLPQLTDAVMVCPGFEDYSSYMDSLACRPEKLTGAEALSIVSTLQSIQFTCVYLATKVADQIHALSLLRFLLTNLSHNGAVVSREQAVDIEALCLEALDWRLGPFFLEDDLTGNDEGLWAAAIGHWDYDSSADSSA